MASAAPEPSALQAWQDRLTASLDIVLAVLALVMLVLLVVELGGLAGEEWTPRVVQAGTVIWAIFVLAFLFELSVAPSKTRYLRSNWLAALSLAIPFLRIFRVARAVRVLRAGRALRGLTLGRVLGALNRARKALLSFTLVSQLAYLALLAVVVTITAAAAGFAFERGAPETQIGNFGDAFWWAVTVVTAGGGDIEMTTVEGRIVSVLLRVFGLAVVGYLTARLAVFFLGPAAPEASGNAGDDDEPTQEELAALREEIRALREAISRDGIRERAHPQA